MEGSLTGKGKGPRRDVADTGRAFLDTDMKPSPKSLSLAATSRRRKHPPEPTGTQAKTSGKIIFAHFVKSACAPVKLS